MKLQLVLVVGFVLSVVGCTEKEQVMPEQADAAPMNDTVASSTENEMWQNESFRKHMHLHAEKLDDINFALADGDLDAAKAPANWLATHDTDGDVQSDWLPYLYAMRTEAEAVEAARDLATARAASERINAQCQTCHNAVGFSPQ